MLGIHIHISASIGHFFEKAVGAIVHVVSKVGKDVFDVMTMPLRTELVLVEALVKGQRLDKAAMMSFKADIKTVHEIAPYVQTVIAFVPGIGPVASACIGGGLALAEGKPIDEIVASAIAGALPGGPFVKAAYDMGKDVIQHKPVLTVVTQGLGVAASGLGFAAQGAGGIIDVSGQASLVSGLTAAHDIASGGKTAITAAATIDAAIAKMKLTSHQKAQFTLGLKVGAAVGYAQNLQQQNCKDITSPGNMTALQRAGLDLQRDPVILAARAGLKGEGTHGFDIGAAAMHSKNVVQYTLHCLRGTLSVTDQKGFDTALALKIGRVKMGASSAPPAVQAGQAITHGLKVAPSTIQSQVQAVVIANPDMTIGAATAVRIERWADLALTVAGLAVGAVTGGPVGAVVGAGVGFTIGITATQVKKIFGL
jgi:hypothetical protein